MSLHPDYPFAEAMIRPDPDAGTTLVLLDRDATLTALHLDLFRDALAIRCSVVFLAKDQTTLDMAVGSFMRLAREPAPTVH